MATKVATVIANEAGQGLILKVGNRNCFVRIATVRDGGEYTMRLCVDWTYQEFVLEDKSDPRKKLFVNSDDCCDYERITVKESDGVFTVERVPRKELRDNAKSDIALDQHTTVVNKEIFCWRFWRQLKLLLWYR